MDNTLDKFSPSRIIRRCAQFGIEYDEIIRSMYFISNRKVNNKVKNPLLLQYQEAINGTTGWGISKRALSDKDVIPFEKEEIRKMLKIESFLFNRNSFVTEHEYYEGAPFILTITKYERDINARIKCLEIKGYNCSVCDINFEEKYGAEARNFIHVHHLTPIALIKKEYKIDPIKDLAPVCPNCHSVIHKRNPPYTIEEMKTLISK